MNIDPIFEYRTTIKMHEVDAAGALFFANQFILMHDAYEAFLESRGLAMGSLIRQSSFRLPIVHAESDFKLPLSVGDAAIIALKIKHIGTTSFTVAYDIYTTKNELAGTGETVHVSIDRETGLKIPLPGECLAIITDCNQ